MIDIIKCSQVIGYTNVDGIGKWSILLLDDTEIYTSDRYLEWDTWKCDLRKLDIYPGQYLRVKVEFPAKGTYRVSDIIQYQHDGSAVYFEAIGSAKYFNFNFNGEVPIIDDIPVLKCSAISAKHISGTLILHWGLINEAGELIYKSGKCPSGDTWSMAFSKLNIQRGSRLILKAIVTSGADSNGYIVLEYDPDSTNVAKFGFMGNAFKTVVIYEGDFMLIPVNNIIEDYKKIEEYKNMILESYKNLIVCYEESRQLYEKIIKQYENSFPSEQQVIKCSRIIADNNAWVTTNWQLISTTGEVLYTSGKYALGDTWIENLSSYVIPIGTVFYLKANVNSGDDSQSSVYLECDPTSNYTAYFQLTGTAFKTTLHYISNIML